MMLHGQFTTTIVSAAQRGNVGTIRNNVVNHASLNGNIWQSDDECVKFDSSFLFCRQVMNSFETFYTFFSFLFFLFLLLGGEGGGVRTGGFKLFFLTRTQIKVTTGFLTEYRSPYGYDQYCVPA